MTLKTRKDQPTLAYANIGRGAFHWSYKLPFPILLVLSYDVKSIGIIRVE